MEDKFAIQLFEDNKVRVVWNEEQEKYFFSVVDIIQVLTDSVNPTDYIKKMKPICRGSSVLFSLFRPRKQSL